MQLQLRGKALVAITSVLLIALGASLYLQSSAVERELVAVKAGELRAELERYRAVVDSFTDNQQAKAKTLARLGEWLYAVKQRTPAFDAPAAAMAVALAELSGVGDPAIRGGGLWFEPNVLEPDRRWVGPYAVVDGPGQAKPTWEFSNEDYGYTRQGWYTIAIPAEWDRQKPRDRDLYMTTPYLDTLHGHPAVFISFTRPMYSPERALIGVATADWTCDSLKSALTEFHVTPGSSAFLVDPTSHKVLVPTGMGKLKGVDETEWWRHLETDIRVGEIRESPKRDVAGVTYDILYTRTKAGLVLGFLINEREAYAVIGQMTSRNVVLIILTLFVVGCLMYLLVSRFLRPLRNLAASADRIAGGDVDHRAQIETRDEVGALARAFNQATDFVRASEARFRAMVEHAADIIAILEVDGTIRYASPAVSRVLGIAPDDLIGWPFTNLLRGDDIAAFEGAIAQVRPKDPVNSLEVRVRVAGATEAETRTLEIILTAMTDEPHGAVVLNARDISERKQAEDALAQSLDQLRQSQKLEAIGRLAGGMAHDFNNVLTAVLCNTSMMLEDYADNVALVGQLKEIDDAGRHAAALTEQLLAFSRRQVSKPRVVDANAVVEGIHKMLGRLLGDDVELSTALEPNLPPIYFDPRLMEQVIVNLVVNARDAMPDGGSIAIATRRQRIARPTRWLNGPVSPGAYVALEVRDTGVGIDAKTAARMFEPFFTTKDQGRGTGLGLSMVYGIINQADARIQMSSTPGQGTTFTILWRSTDLSAEPEPAAPLAIRPAADAEIVVLEDDARVRKSVVHALHSRGFRVTAFESPAEAVAFLRSAEPVDLLITDVVMPGMSGPEVVRAVRAARPELRVLYTSGYPADALDGVDLEANGQGLLRKPFTAETLTTAVSRLLEKRGAAPRTESP